MRPIAAVKRSIPSTICAIVFRMVAGRTIICLIGLGENGMAYQWAAFGPKAWSKSLEQKMAQKHPHHHDDSEHSSELSEMQLRVRALETVLTEKGYVDPPALDAIIEAYETKIGPHIGARVV